MPDVESVLRMKMSSGRKILSIFLTAGYPTLALTAPLVVAMAEAGADLFEIGIPFSDPIADGPVIQRSSEIALLNGTTIDRIFDIIAGVRKRTSVPIILMSYMNPVRSYGPERFLRQCRASGVDGTIIADLPLEESDEYRKLAGKESVATIFLAAPTTPVERLEALDAATSGFLYCVSVTGVTGERSAFTEQTADFLNRVKKHATRHPVLVGFGIATKEDARTIAGQSDGVVIGSALINKIASAPPGEELATAASFVAGVRRELDSGD